MLKVKSGVSKVNILAMTLVMFTTLQLILFYNISFVYLLQSEENFNLTTEESSTIIGDLIFWAQLLTLPFDFIGGSFHDIFGRNLTIFFGLVIGALSVAV